MCGISGVIQRRSHVSTAGSLKIEIEKMNYSQRHRGPDGAGVFIGRNFAFGHTRLAILDLSAAGDQPMKHESQRGGDLVITYNGEIYNYVEIREELKILGHVFRTQTDTEVLLNAYDEWGEDCVEKFNGMFAFVLYDARRDLLFGARDRFGVKPFYFRQNSERFEFASEIKALLATGASAGPDIQTIVDYLYAGHLNISDRTFFGDIKELRGGHRFIYNLKTHDLITHPWYELGRRVLPIRIEEKEAARNVAEILADSVRLRMRSDVRIGTCLSGGIDSSSIASIAAGLHGQTGFVGITASSLDPTSDETHYAKTVADALSLEWHTVLPLDFRDDLDDVICAQDEPFGGLSVFMQYNVMKVARAIGVPVLLDGQGGDEVFLGYPKYRQAKAWPGFNLLAKAATSHLGIVERRDFESDLEASASGQLAEAKAHLLAYRRALSNATTAQILDITTTNLPQLLRYEDRNSMRHSIEARLPFLDYRLVEFGVGLPFEHKISADGTLKHVLRDAMRGIVPSAILARTDKVGFAPPALAWLTHFDDLWHENVSGSELLREICHRTVACGPAKLSTDSQWKLINLAIWSKKYFT